MSFLDLFQPKPGVKRIALLVDGPNMIRSQFNVRLEEVLESLSEFGQVRVAKVFLNQYASDKLIEAISNTGCEPIVMTTDADVPMAISAMDCIYNPHIDTIALMTRDSDLHHVFLKAKEKGKQTILLTADDQLAVSLKNSADKVIMVKTHAAEKTKLKPREEKPKEAGEMK